MKEVEECLKEVIPIILGGLLDAVAAALKNFDSVDTTHLPRMSDFAKWVIAAEPALPWRAGQFLEIYDNHRIYVVQESVESDLVGGVISSWIEDREGTPWSGSATQLLSALDEHTDSRITRNKLWPEVPSHLSQHLTRLMPLMRQIGIEITRGTGRRRRTIFIEDRRAA